MARKVRLEYPGAVYHAMCRGDRREDIFLDEKDRWLFLDTLAQACGRAGMLVHAYVLMSNHYHLLLETPEGNLVAGMRWFQSTYTARFNARHQLVGHLFQGRYRAIPLDPEDATSLRTVSDYIHLNPARAGLLTGDSPRLGSYGWSSYRAFTGNKPLPPWLVRTRVFRSLDLPDEEAGSRRRFAAYLARRLGEVLGRKETEEQRAAWAQVRRGWVIGDEAFRDRLLRRAAKPLAASQRDSHAGDEWRRRHDLAEAENLLRRIASAWGGVDWAKCPANDPGKQVAAWLLRGRTTAGGAWIAGQLAMGHVSNVSRACRAVQDAKPSDVRHRLRKELMHICKD